jgi:hypothetical protein
VLSIAYRVHFFRAFMALSRLSPRLSEWITLVVSLSLGIPIAYFAWEADEYWMLFVLLILMTSAVALLAFHGREMKSASPNSAGEIHPELLGARQGLFASQEGLR